jgi:hypothetical protein
LPEKKPLPSAFLRHFTKAENFVCSVKMAKEFKARRIQFAIATPA